MSVRTFLGCLGALTVVVAFLWVAVNQWHYETIGPFEVRQHGMTGILQIRRGGRWEGPFVPDRSAPPVPEDDLKSVRLVDLTWGPRGLLCGRASTAPFRPVRGRLAFVLLIRDGSGKRFRDRALRQSVDWPAGATIDFALDTGLASPQPPSTATITLEHINSPAAEAAGR